MWHEWTVAERRSALKSLQAISSEFRARNQRDATREYLVAKLKDLHSRQIEDPPLGEFCHLVEMCTLHVGLTAFSDLLSDFYFKFLMEHLCGGNKSKYDQLPREHAVKMLVEALQKAGASRLAKNVHSRWNEGAKSLEYRFRGQKVALFCQHFHKVMAKFAHLCDRTSIVFLCTFHKLTCLLRDITRLMNLTDITAI